MTAGSHKAVHPHLPKTDDRCVRLIIDFSNIQELIGFAQRTIGLLYDYDYLHKRDTDLYKVTAAQFHSVPVGNHYIVASGGHDDLKLTPDRIRAIFPPEEGVAEEENYNDHKDHDTL